jgi:uncharacterized protein YbaR (Trm112 family)
MSLDPLLLEILVDPNDRGPLWYFDEDSLLYNPRAKVAYAIVDSIPVLLPEEGRQLDAAEAAELDAKEAKAEVTGIGRS